MKRIAPPPRVQLYPLEVVSNPDNISGRECPPLLKPKILKNELIMSIAPHPPKVKKIIPVQTRR